MTLPLAVPVPHLRKIPVKCFAFHFDQFLGKYVMKAPPHLQLGEKVQSFTYCVQVENLVVAFNSVKRLLHRLFQ